MEPPPKKSNHPHIRYNSGGLGGAVPHPFLGGPLPKHKVTGAISHICKFLHFPRFPIFHIFPLSYTPPL